MTTKHALTVALPLALLAACGSSSNSTIYTLTTGTYAVSSATLSSTQDECGLLPAYQDPAKVIGVVVASPAVTFNLANDPGAAANTLPTATIDGNVIGTPVEANYTVAFGTTGTSTNCVVRVKRSVTGDITANDATALTLSFSAATETGTCVAADTSFTKLPCASSYHFLAKKK